MMALAYQVGQVRVHLLSDGVIRSDGGGAFGVVPRILWEKVTPPDALNRIAMDVRSLLIESSAGPILVDTGHGSRLTEKRRQQLALADGPRLPDALAAIGYRPDDITTVINTHLHADHCGANIMAGSDGRPAPAFPRATYLAQRLELADATYPNERTRNAYFRENFLPLADLCDDSGTSVLRVMNGDECVTPEVRVQVTPGHTRAHQVVIIESAGESAVFLGDAIAYAISLEKLAWVPAFDIEPLVSMETKRNLRDWVWRNDALLLFQHDPLIPAGRLRREGGQRGDGDAAWRVEPVATP